MRLLPSMAILTGITLSGTTLYAQESFSVGPRHLGMGGTGVATADDVPAQYYNPAAYGFFSYQAPRSNPPAAMSPPSVPPAGPAPEPASAEQGGQLTPPPTQAVTNAEPLPSEQDNDLPSRFDNNALYRKDFGFAVDFSFGARIHKDFVDHVDTLRKFYDDGTFDSIGGTGFSSSTQAETDAKAKAFVEIVNALSNLQDPDNAMSIDMNTGVAARIGHFGLGVRAFSQVAARLQSLDFANLGLGGLGDLDSQLGSITAPGSGSVLTTAQQNQLQLAGISAGNVTTIDQLAAQAGISTDQTQALVDALTIVVGGGGGTLDNNTTAARIYGAGIMEIPLTFGYALNEHFAIGGNLKGMIGRVYGSDVLIFKDDAIDQLNNARDNYKQTVTWGIDLSVMYRMRMLQLGLTARNLNAPSFEGPTVGLIKYNDYTLDPAVTAGVAFIPYETLSFAVDLDLTTNESILNNYDTQMLRLGGEWDIFRILALRAGYSMNLAEDDIGALVHAGVGINLWAIRFDVAGAMALETTTYDGSEVPREARLSAQLAVDF
jgi:F plasmid transfer operon, TraF, protein